MPPLPPDPPDGPDGRPGGPGDDPSGGVRRRGRPRDDALTDRLISTALDILATGGPQRLNAERLAARVGAGKAAIYRRWPAMSHLISDALLQCSLVPAARRTGSVADDLAAVLEPWTRDLDRDERAAAAVLGEAWHDAEVQASLERLVVRPLARSVAEVVDQHVRPGGGVPPDRVRLVQVVVQALWWERWISERPPLTAAELHAVVDRVLVPLLDDPAPGPR